MLRRRSSPWSAAYHRRVSTSANARYAIAAAPSELELAHEFLNTWPHEGARGSDLLADAPSALDWLAYARTISSAVGEVGEVTGADLVELRALRDQMRSVISGASEPAGSAVVRTVSVQLTPTGELEVRGSGTVAERVGGAVLAEMLLAQSRGTLSRLKICADPTCAGAFYDNSPNQSRVWHNSLTCGNRMNLRASRARKRLIETEG